MLNNQRVFFVASEIENGGVVPSKISKFLAKMMKNRWWKLRWKLRDVPFSLGIYELALFWGKPFSTNKNRGWDKGMFKDKPIFKLSKFAASLISSAKVYQNLGVPDPYPQNDIDQRWPQKTRRRMARERRGAESSSAVSMATLYYKTIY